MSNFIKDLSKTVGTLMVVIPVTVICQGVGEHLWDKTKDKLKKEKK